MAEENHLEPLVLIEDEPVPGHWVDELDLETYARIVAGAAVGTGGPFTIGVFADWGLGKTSLLRQAKSLIEADPQHAAVVTVWFNAWQFEKEEHPIVPLVASIVRAVERKRAELQTKTSKAAQALLAGLTKTSRALRAVAYGFSAKAKLKMPGFAELEAGFVAKEMVQRYEALDKPQDDPLLDRSLYYSAFETLEEVAGRADPGKGEPGPKIVVFVDDLDRCLPDNGLRLLEGIKLVLAQRGFVFALAVDRRIIESYLNERYKTVYGMPEYAGGVSYLDKIVQLPLHLPSHRGRFEKYITELLKRPSLSHDQEVHDALEDLVHVLAVGANANPRSLVRFINSLLVARRLYLRGETAPDADFLRICAVSHVLREQLGDALYRALLEDDELCDALAAGRGKPIRERIADRKEESHRATQWRSIRSALDRKPFLIDLLDDEDSGRRWLTRHETRRAVDQFLIVESAKPKPEPAPASQVEIIEEAIRASLEMAHDAPVTDQDRSRVRELDLSGKADLTDAGLAHLSALTGLQDIDLSWCNKITDAGLEHLARLTNLQSLHLWATSITDAGLEHLSALTSLRGLTLDACWEITHAGLEHLSALTSLQQLSLGNTHITDGGLEHLAALTGLQKLNLSKCEQITDAGLAHLSALTGLQRLELSGTQVTDVSPLAGLTALQTLGLNDTQVTDVSPLKGLTALKTLGLRRTQVTDVSPLKGLTALQTLDLRNTQVTDVAPLAGLTALQKLYLRGTQVTDVSPLDGIPNLTIHGGPKRRGGR